MVHPMFKIDNEVKKYPLFGKALEATFSEVEGALFWTIGEMPLLSLPGKIIATVEKTLDGTPAEKQAVMIGALYSFAPQSLARGNFAAHYDAHTAAVLTGLATYDRVRVAPEKTAQVSAVAGTVLMSAMMPAAHETVSITIPPSAVVEAKKALAEANKLLLPNLNAPRLEAEYNAANAAYIALMEGNTPAARNKRPPAAFKP
ncbi:MAG: hypothetical protein PSY14_02660 [bacterium]|nr:hypothetical protein [bacterium]